MEHPEYTFVVRKPDTAYVDNWLWLPKNMISVETLKRALTIPLVKGGDIVHMHLFRESRYHLGIPRGRMGLHDPRRCELVDLRPKEFQRVDIRSNVVLDYLDPDKGEQQLAYADIKDAECGILNIACGKGKTVVLLHAIANWGVPALVINDKGHILKQWKEEAQQFLEMDGPIGLIQGNPKKWKWEGCPITLASLRTLVLHAKHVTPEMSAHFGVVLWDEIHHLAAERFSVTAPMFLGRRYGATATIERADGLQSVYQWHVGRAQHVNLEQDIKPTVTVVRSRTSIDMKDPPHEVLDKAGQINARRLAKYVGLLPEEMALAKRLVQLGIDRGRDMIAISISKDHSRALHAEFPGSGVVDGDVPPEDRLGILRENKITFGTADLMQEAINKQMLDALLILNEFRSSNMLQQSVGRIQRAVKGVDKKAHVLLIWHVNIPPMKRRGERLLQLFKRWGYKVKVV